jgi:predicted Zn-dependent protease
LLAVLLAVPGAMAQGLPELGDATTQVLPPALERRLGEQVMLEIRQREPSYVDDPELNAYIQQLGSRLVAASREGRQDFEFFFISDPSINAFAMPGGFVGVHTGLVLAAQTESEVASVLGHEVAHVTQRHIARLFGKQSQISLPSMAALVLAMLVARSNPGASGAAVAALTAGNIQAQINYTRDFEREADRVGFALLEGAGFDVSAMPSFFERLQKAGRVGDSSAPAYLRTHPLNFERIADMQNRIKDSSYRQAPDSLDFQLVKGRLRAELGRPQDAVAQAQAALKERRFSSEAGARFGYAWALRRANDNRRAEAELLKVRSSVAFNPMVELLYARLRQANGSLAEAQEILRVAAARVPAYRPLQYAVIAAQQDAGDHAGAVAALSDLAKTYPRDPRLQTMLAKSFTATGNRLQFHRAMAEANYLQGALLAAIEQLQLAQRSGEGDFYQQSAVDARLREIRSQLAEDTKQQRR